MCFSRNAKTTPVGCNGVVLACKRGECFLHEASVFSPNTKKQQYSGVFFKGGGVILARYTGFDT